MIEFKPVGKDMPEYDTLCLVKVVQGGYKLYALAVWGIGSGADAREAFFTQTLMGKQSRDSSVYGRSEIANVSEYIAIET